jgi:hypothetical protein
MLGTLTPTLCRRTHSSCMLMSLSHRDTLLLSPYSTPSLHYECVLDAPSSLRLLPVASSSLARHLLASHALRLSWLRPCVLIMHASLEGPVMMLRHPRF